MRPGVRQLGPELEPDDEFGFIPPADVPSLSFGEVASKPPPELVALGPPPADAAGIQRWSYQLLTTMAYLVVKDETISQETRLKRAAALTAAAARHYPEAERADLRDRISRDAEEIAGRKRAKAAGRAERRDPARGAKIIPIRKGEIA